MRKEREMDPLEAKAVRELLERQEKEGAQHDA